MKEKGSCAVKRWSKTMFALLLVLSALLGMRWKADAADTDVICQNQDLVKACDIQGHVNVETDFGNLVTDALRWYAEADIAFLPSVEFANHLQPGEVTRSSLAYSLERNSVTAVTDLTVSEIYAYLETGISYILIKEDYSIDWENSYSDGYLQVSGIKVKYDTAAPVGEKVMSLTLSDGTVLERGDTDTTYRVASTAELLSGGFGYPEADEVEELETEIDVVSSYLSHLETVGIPEETKRTKLLGTREIFVGYGRMIGALIGVFGLIITFTIAHIKKRLGRKEEELNAEAEQYEIDK